MTRGVVKVSHTNTQTEYGTERNMTVDLNKLNTGHINQRELRVRARGYCLDCAGSDRGVEKCRHGLGETMCVLYPYRNGGFRSAQGSAGVKRNPRPNLRVAIKSTCQECVDSCVEDVCPDADCSLHPVLWFNPSAYWEIQTKVNRELLAKVDRLLEGKQR